MTPAKPRSAASPERGVTTVAFVVIPRFNMAALTTTLEPMRIANYLSNDPVYSWSFVSAEGGERLASNGMSLGTLSLDDLPAPVDVVFVCSSWSCEQYRHDRLFGWLRKHERDGGALVSMDTGAYLLARAGLLAGRQATLHWSCLAGFSEQFPDVLVTEQLFTHDGRIMTTAGGTAGIDLVLHMIARKHGEQLSSEIADQFLHHPIRPANTPQRHTLGARSGEMNRVVRKAVQLIETSIEEPVRVPEIANRLGVSQRQLERLFHHDMGCSVVQFGKLLRLQHARVLLTSTQMSIREVSAACGFNSLSYFSQAFSKCFGKKPSAYRQAWPEQEPGPSWPGTIYSFMEKTRTIAASKPHEEV